MSTFFNYLVYIMNIRYLNKKKAPVVKIDKSLDEYNDTVLFPDKLKKANDMLRTIGLPKKNKKQQPD
jgi:hypothetical protein